MSLSRAFAILGPTASGKTALALSLAQQFNCEIISLDSALVYRDMDVGTAKPTATEMAQVPHHLIDIISPLQAYSAADFVDDCVCLVGEIRARGRIPLIVGGTMMYFHALTQGLNQLPQADESVRAALQQEKNTHGLAHLYQRLQTIDPETAARLKPNDAQRIERALEVFLLTNTPLSAHFQAASPNQAALDLYTLTLVPENRALLHAHINQRFETMLANGFVQEMKNLQQNYPELTPDMPSMRCVGYRQAWSYLAGEIDETEFIAQGQAATRQLAKRQLTWLRKLPADCVLDPYAGIDLVQAASVKLAEFEGV
ncbi:tRNA (adenosine(37)-N6)-dimethylallyltransferase MiaA [Neisseriaceae bacterium B1]